MLALLTLRLGAAMIGIAAAIAFLTWSHTHAYQAGRTAERTETLSRSVELLRERTIIDDTISNLGSADLCHALGGEWLREYGTCQ